MCQNIIHNITVLFTLVFWMHLKFDNINHFKLFRKLLDRKTHTCIVIVRILLFWYSKQTVCVKWGRCISDYFSISNGVRQCRILSPKLFSVYVDDFSDKLVESKVGCSIDNLCMNHVMYADDICLMAPSPAALLVIINICYDFRVQNDLSFNSSKSYCMVFSLSLNYISYHVHYYIWTVRY